MGLFEINLPKVGKEYIEFANDVLKLTVSLLVAFLVSRTASTKNNFMDIAFSELYMYLLIGYTFYHLLVKDLIELSPIN